MDVRENLKLAGIFVAMASVVFVAVTWFANVIAPVARP